MRDDATQLDADDVAFLQETLRPHGTRLRDYLHRLIPEDVRRVVDASDVVQDTFFEAATLVRQIPCNDEHAVWRWLVTIARHKLTDRIREFRAAKRGGGRFWDRRESEGMHGSVILLLEELAVHSHTPSRSAVRRELLTALERSMDVIEPDYKAAVRYRYIEGFSLGETAQRMSRTEDSVKKLCLRGLRALRNEMRSASLFL